jgi:hypothetical protein
MRALLAVAAREVVERRMLLGLGLVGAVVPLAYPYLGVPRDAWRFLCVAYAFSLTVATALLAGGSVIGRDLAERRLGFFFARPLSTASLWGGKMLAALVLTATTLALASLPLSWLGLGDVTGEGWTKVTVGSGSLALVALIGLAHAASVGYRSRSPWFTADLILTAAAAFWTAHLVRTLLADWLIPPVVTLLALAAAAPTLASAAQLAIGRTDARRGHAALSLVLWTVLFTGLALVQARTYWLVHPRWSDLLSADSVESSPRGDWIAVVGPARGRGRMPWAFLTNLATGRSMLIGSARSSFVFAASGRRAAWVSQVREDLDTTTVSVLDLDGPDLEPRSQTLPWRSERSIAIALSPDGSRLLAFERGAAVVVDLDGRRPPLRVPFPAGFLWQAAFIDAGRVRLFHNDQSKAFVGLLRILDLDVATGSLTEAGRIATRGNSWVRMSPDGTRLLTVDRPDRHPSLALYTATGSHVATLRAAGAATTQIAADFLADGRIVVVQKDPSVRLHVYSADGAEQRAVELADRWSRARLGGEAAAGQYLMGLSTANDTERQTVTVDLASGRIVRREAGLLPASWIWPFTRDAGALRAAPGSRATRLFKGDGDVLVEVDPSTGARRTVLGR